MFYFVFCATFNPHLHFSSLYFNKVSLWRPSVTPVYTSKYLCGKNFYESILISFLLLCDIFAASFHISCAFLLHSFEIILIPYRLLFISFLLLRLLSFHCLSCYHVTCTEIAVFHIADRIYIDTYIYFYFTLHYFSVFNIFNLCSLV
jgi:hypothetical protein